MAWYQQLNGLLYPLAHPAGANRPRPPRSGSEFSRAIREGHPHYVTGPTSETKLTLVACGTPSEALLLEVHAQAHQAGFQRLRSIGPGGIIPAQFPPVPLDMTPDNAYTYAHRQTGPGPVLLITDGASGWPHYLDRDRLLVAIGHPPYPLRGQVIAIPERAGPAGP